MSGELWSAAMLSLRIAVVATACTAAVGVPLAYLLRRRRFPGRSLVEAVILLPMVLPPTVVGYAILMVLGARGALAPWLAGYSIVFRFEGAVLAAAVVALPMLYLPAKAAFASVEREAEESALLLGARARQVFWRVSLPSARHGVLSGLALAFARAVGEFGATVMVFGWQPGRETLPISVYADYERGDLGDASAASAALSLISLALVLLYNRSTARRQDRA